MKLLLMTHLVLLGSWGGVVAVESVFELLSLRRDRLQAAVAEIHYWVDLVVELPVVVGVVASGVSLLFVTPWRSLLAVKVTCAALAVATNLACIGIVVKRYRALQAGETGSIAGDGRRIVAFAAVGIPLAAVAAVLGLSMSPLR